MHNDNGMGMILMMGTNGKCYSYLGSRVYSTLIYQCLNSIALFVVIYTCWALWLTLFIPVILGKGKAIAEGESSEARAQV